MLTIHFGQLAIVFGTIHTHPVSINQTKKKPWYITPNSTLKISYQPAAVIIDTLSVMIIQLTSEIHGKRTCETVCRRKYPNRLFFMRSEWTGKRKGTRSTPCPRKVRPKAHEKFQGVNLFM